MGESGDCLPSCMQMTWFCGESEEDLRVMVGQFAEVCRRRGLKVNTGKSKVMVLNGLDGTGLEYEVYVDGVHLKNVSEFKYLRYVLDKSGIDGVECSRKVASGRRVTDAIRFLVNARDLQLECVRVLHEILLAPVFMYGSKTMLWKEKEKSRAKAVQMDNLRGLLGIRRIDRILNARIMELCRVKKGLDERIDEGIL